MNLIKRTLGKQELDMLLQLITVPEGLGQSLNNRCFLRSQGIRVSGIQSREIGVIHHIRFTINGNRSVFKVYLIKQKPVFHLKLRMSLDHLSLQLKLNYSDSLMNPHIEFQVPGVIIVTVFDFEGLAICVLIGLHCKSDQWD